MSTSRIMLVRRSILLLSGYVRQERAEIAALISVELCSVVDGN